MLLTPPFSDHLQLKLMTGAVSLEYPLSQQPVVGNWTIRVVAQGQEEQKQFLVEEYCECPNLIPLPCMHSNRSTSWS